MDDKKNSEKKISLEKGVEYKSKRDGDKKIEPLHEKEQIDYEMESDDEDDDDYDEGDVVSMDQSDISTTNYESNTIQQHLKMYNTVKHSSVLGNMEPLILDIGVSLPPSSYSSPLGKVVEETQYRFAWRNYFRYHRFIEFHRLYFSLEIIL